MLGRIALLHRVGAVELTEAAVVVAVSAPHRAEAFEAARCGDRHPEGDGPDLEA